MPNIILKKGIGLSSPHSVQFSLHLSLLLPYTDYKQILVSNDRVFSLLFHCKN